MNWIDAHTHLDSDELFAQKAEVLKRAEAVGIKRLLVVNSEVTENSFRRTLQFAGKSGPIETFVSLGVHPHHASQYTEKLEALVLALLQQPSVIAFGEIGLDFHYNFSPPDVQRTVLRRQLALAREKRLPVVIHCRDAYGELVEIVRSISSDWRGMIHCFTGNTEEAKSLLDLGFHISFSGIVTFKTANTLREAAKFVPPDRMLIETDAPYLAPVPHRGKTNEPSFVIETARALARVKEIELSIFADRIWKNFDALFLS